MGGDSSAAGTGGGPGREGGLEQWLPAVVKLLDDEERREFFGRHPELEIVAFVELLYLEASKAMVGASSSAETLVGAARWLAEEIGDPSCRGLSLRAAANLRLYAHDYQGALSYYEKALECFEEAGDDLGVAITCSTGLGCLSQLGEYEKAHAWAETAREILEERGDRLRLARLVFNLGHVYVRQDRFREALARFHAAYELFVEIGTPADIGLSLRNLAVCHQDLGELDLAVETYERAREHCTANGLTVTLLEIEYNIAYVYYLRGEYTRAIGEYELTRRRCREHGDRYHEGLCDMDQAEIYLELNLVDEAADLAAAAAERLAELGAVYDAGKSLAYQALAVSRRREGERALELLDRARELFARQENLLWLSMIDFYRAQVVAADGRFEAAVELAEDALDGFSEAAIDGRTMACELLLARLALETGDHEEAQRRSLSALGRLERAGTPALEFQAHMMAARTEEASGNARAALALYEKSERILERLRGGLGTDDLKIAFSRDKKELYEAMLLLNLRLRPGREGRRLAFEIVERAKSRALIDLLAFKTPELGARSPAEESLVEEMRVLRRELHWHHRRIDQEELRGLERSLPRVAELRRKAREGERRLQGLMRRLRAADPDLALLQHAGSADLEEVREVLPAEGVLLEYFIARGEIFACVLGRERLIFESLGPAADLRRLDRHLRLQLGKAVLGPRYQSRFEAAAQNIMLKILSEMYDQLVAPVRRHLEGRHLVIVPHGFLHQLPFAAFHDGDRHLLDEYTISFAPSATVLRLCCQRASDLDGGALILGVPDERAPLIEEEVRAVAGVLPGSRLRIGAEATYEELVEHGPGRAVVHLATHGHHRVDNPMFSAIQLGGGRLSLFDLYHLRLNAGLVVLSGCATGLSSVEGADELVGLTRGLLHAGAHSLIATLWDINDKSTTQLMRSFYSGLKEGSSPAEELRRAQLELRETYPGAYYWAPFVLVGRPEPGKLSLSRSAPRT